MADENLAIGIDLGTTYSVVSVYRNNQVEIIHNDLGLYTTASWVSFTDNERIIGDAAKDRSVINPANTVFGVKRFLGRSYDDQEFQHNLLTYPYEIIDGDNKPMIEVRYKGEIKQFAPEEISAMVLEKMKSFAETFLNQKVTDAVITVPAHFNDAQRQATKNAGRIAGLNVLRIINEPTAAALAYGLHNKYKEMTSGHTILVYDFGGGTFDVSIINIENGIFEVKATKGEPFLGGDDIDINLTNHFIKEFKQKHKIDLNKEKRAVRRLRHQCEKLKRNLTFTEKGTIDLELIYKEIDFSSTLERSKFEQLNSKLFDKTLDCVKKALKDAKMKKEDINEVVLIGGSSRIPRVRNIVQKFFNNKDLNASLNPDEAVARGAAIQAGILGITRADSLASLLLYDVNPLSLGIETVGGEMSVIIPRSSKIPTNQTETYETSENNQTSIMITVYEGEGILVKRNRKLGEFIISGIQPKPRGEVMFDVTFEVNVDGILNVRASELNGNLKKKLSIDSNKGHLNEDEIQRMINEADKYREEDEQLKLLIKAKIWLQQYCTDLKDELFNLELNDDDNKICSEKYDEILEWIDEEEDVTVEKCEIKKKEMDDVIMPVLKRYN